MENIDEKSQIEQFSKYIDDLQKIGKKILNLKDQFRQLELDMNIHVNHAAKLFAMRQFEQLEAMLLLSDNENIILISRSMFEGAVYIGCFCVDAKLAEDWRNYAFVIDQIRVNNGENAPEEILELLKNNKSRIDGFKQRNGKFYYSWTKGEKIKKLSSIAKLEHFYENYYSKMSDYHHWGTKSLGIRYKCLTRNIVRNNTAEIKLESLEAWCMSISSILSVLSILNSIAKNSELENKIIELKKELSCIDGMKSTEINYGQFSQE